MEGRENAPRLDSCYLNQKGAKKKRGFGGGGHAEFRERERGKKASSDASIAVHMRRSRKRQRQRKLTSDWFRRPGLEKNKTVEGPIR